MTSRARRELGLSVVLALGGAAVVLLATTGSTAAQGSRAARACALVALAGAVALLAARGWSRLAVALILAAAGLGLILLAGGPLGDGELTVANAAVGAGGLLVLSAGALAAARGRGWPALGARYDAPAGPRRIAASDAWDALDRGEDPTAPEDTPAGSPRAD